MNKLIDIEIVKGDLLVSISERFNISYDELIEELNKITKLRIVKSKYSCDHNFFSRDNEKSFYWAGFIAADGCVHKKIKHNNKTLSINLAEKDVGHLKCFKTDINFDGPIYKSISKHSLKNPKWKDSVKRSLMISSAQIFSDLKRFNIIPRKTHIYKFPEWLVEHKLVHHYMRGYIDGDGSFFYDKSRNRVCFELRGTYDFLVEFKRIIDSHLIKQPKTTVTTPDSTSKIKYYGKKNVPEIVNFLYKDATIYLSRKREIAKKAITIFNGSNYGYKISEI